MDIKKLRAMRNSSDIGKLTTAFEKMNSNKSYEDNRIWKPTVDKAGNAAAIIRFLPAIEGDDLPFVKIFTHGFKSKTGQWYIENSLTTIGLDDPVSELNSELWNTDIEANKEIARNQKRKLNYFSNILVVSDPANPENEGKVFLFRYGTKIFEKIMDMAQPTLGDDPVDVFDYWNGANFKLRQKKVEGFPNYDSSSFAPPSEIGTDEFILEIAKQQHSLTELLDPKNFKSYEELKKRLDFVLGKKSKPSYQSDEEDKPVEPEYEDDDALLKEKQVSSRKVKESITDDDDDDMKWLEKLKAEIE